MSKKACCVILATSLCSYFFVLCVYNQYVWSPTWRNRCYHPPYSERHKNLSGEVQFEGLVLIAVMTHFGTISTRAVAIHKTWGQDVPGKVIFFVGNTGKTEQDRSRPNKTEVDLPLVVLSVPDDVYPPQEKAFLMLKYVYEHHGDSFRWFIRADDDVYINNDNLGALLISLPGRDDVLLGHPGIGTNEEKGKLGLADQSNFCIGGTGIIMSKSVLRKVYPQLDYCIKHTATEHEDSEVGRCLRKFVGVQCPWGYEASEIFYQDYGDDQQAYHGNLDLIPLEKAVSLHPVKDARYLYRLHYHFLSMRHQKKQGRAGRLKEQLENTEKILTLSKGDDSFFRKSAEYFCHNRHCDEFHSMGKLTHDERLPPKTWAMFQELGFQSFGVRQFSSPVEAIISSKAKILRQVTEKAKQDIMQEERSELYHGFYFGEYTVGYTRESPTGGNLYEVHYTVRMKRHIGGQEIKSVREPRRVKFKNSYGSLIFRSQETKPKKELINIVVPAKGSVSRLENFLKGAHQLLVNLKESFRIFVVFFRRSVFSVKTFKNIRENYRKKFGDSKFVWLEVDGKFKQQGVFNATLKHFPKSQLLLFTEANFTINADFLARCRQNTDKGRIYFPLALKTRDKKNAYRKGLWEFENYLTFCAYSADVKSLIDMHPFVNASSESSSMVDLFITHEQRAFDVFRAHDPGLLLLDTARPACLANDTTSYEACTDRFDSRKALIDYMFRKDYLRDFL